MSTRLPKITRSRKKRVGRGYGSGLGGHTAGRGMKGQKARAGGKRHILFEGVKSKKSLLRRLPFLRGKGKFSAKPGPAIVQLGDLNGLKETKITLESLVKVGIITSKEAHENGAKVLSGGVLERKIEVSVPVSKAAGEQIIAKGGKINL